MRPGGDARVDLGGISVIHHNLPGRVTRRYRRPEHLVFVPLVGEIEVGAGGSRFLLGPGRMAYVPAGEHHSLTPSPCGGERLVAMVSEERWRSVAREPLPAQAPSMNPLLREILFFLLLNPGSGGAPALVEAFLGVLAENLQGARSNTCMDHLEGRARDPRLKVAVRFMADNISSPMNMEEVADAGALSVRTLNRLFIREFGMSPKRVLMANRIAKARDLMDTGKLSVTEASAAVGYSSLSQFIAAFREITGQLPSSVAKKRPERSCGPI